MKSIVGKILYDRYRIIQQLSHTSPRSSSGGSVKVSQDNWSTVYLAEDLAANSPLQCQIERLQPQYDHEILGAQSWQKVRQTFETQGQKLKNASQHPQIPQLLAFFESDREFYLVWQHIDGISLKQKLEGGLIDAEEAAVWLQETLEILEFVHQQGIAHLNLQPSSLIEHQDGRKFLTDFAPLKYAILSNSEELCAAINPDFSPPEELKSNFHSDIYSLGKTIVYGLTGKFADSIQTYSDDLSSQLTNTIGAPQADISVELARVLNKMLVSHPQPGYQSVSEVLEEIDLKQNVVTFPPPFVSNNFAPKSTSKNTSRVSKAPVKAARIPKLVWFLLSLPFIIASIIVFVGLNKNSPETPLRRSRNLVEYSNSEHQFSLKYPRTWSEQQIDDPITGEIVVFTSPKETAADLFAEKIYITVEYLSTPTSLEEYSQSVLSRIEDADSSSLELYEDFETKIDNSPARMVIYSRREDSLQLKQMEAFTIKDNRVYVAIYTAEQAKFYEFYPTVEKIISSWEIE